MGLLDFLSEALTYVAVVGGRAWLYLEVGSPTLALSSNAASAVHHGWVHTLCIECWASSRVPHSGQFSGTGESFTTAIRVPTFVDGLYAPCFVIVCEHACYGPTKSLAFLHYSSTVSILQCNQVWYHNGRLRACTAIFRRSDLLNILKVLTSPFTNTQCADIEYTQFCSSTDNVAGWTAHTVSHGGIVT